jgi:hypothetical protein
LLRSGLAYLGPQWLRASAARAVDALPPLGRIARIGAFECRLRARAPRVDLALCLERSLEPVTCLESLHPASLGRARGPWDAALRSVRAWASSEWAWLDAVPVVWIEIDTAPAPAPFLVFTLDRERFHPGGRAAPVRILHLLERLLQAVGARLRPGTLTTLCRVIERLPPSAQLRHVAARPAGAHDDVRLVIQMPWSQAPPFIEAAGFPGRVDQLADALDPLCCDSLVTAVNLDVGPETLGPRVGAEIHYLGVPRDDARWRRALDLLVDRGACTSQRRAAIEAWPSPRADRLAQDRDPRRLIRDLLVKVVYAAGAPLDAKAYLAFAPWSLLCASHSRPIDTRAEAEPAARLSGAGVTMRHGRES